MDPGNGPPPPPHGDNPKSSYGSASDLPSGNYDIFVIPPHSAGSGFIYLPSLRPQTNSFVAGVVCTLGILYAWKVIEPIIRSWFNAISQSGGAGGILVLSLVVGFAGWIYGKTNNNGFQFPGSNADSPKGSPRSGASSPPPPNPNAAGDTPTGKGRSGNANGHANGPGFGSRPNGFTGQQHGQQQHGQSQNQNSSSAWEKAREETRRREEERKKAEDARRMAQEADRRRADAERQAKAAAEKEKWEQMRAREKEQREREEREKQARDRMAASNTSKDAAERDARLKAAQERAEKLRSERAASEKMASERAKSERATPTYGVGERTNLYGNAPAPPKSTIGVSASPKKGDANGPKKPYHHPTAQSYTGTATENAFRPYDTPPRPKHYGSNGSFFSSAYSDASGASESTAPSSYDAGPYHTDDETKVIIKGAFKFTDSFPKPVAIVKPCESGITDGLVMRMDTAGVFLDDDKKREPLRQWDIKTWTMKSIETTQHRGYHVIRASIRDAENTKFVYFVPDAEEWKVPLALKRLKSGSQAKSLPFQSLSAGDIQKIFTLVGGM